MKPCVPAGVMDDDMQQVASQPADSRRFLKLVRLGWHRLRVLKDPHASPACLGDARYL